MDTSGGRLRQRPSACAALHRVLGAEMRRRRLVEQVVAECAAAPPGGRMEAAMSPPGIPHWGLSLPTAALDNSLTEGARGLKHMALVSRFSSVGNVTLVWELQRARELRPDVAASKLRFRGSGHEVGAPCAAGRQSSRPGSCLPYAATKRPSLDCSLAVGGDEDSVTLEHRILGPRPPPVWLSVHIPWSMRQAVGRLPKLCVSSSASYATL